MKSIDPTWISQLLTALGLVSDWKKGAVTQFRHNFWKPTLKSSESKLVQKAFLAYIPVCPQQSSYPDQKGFISNAVDH